MPVIRASDIGAFLYCQRAWWYRKQGIESENQADLTSGIQIHHKHGKGVLAANLARTAGYVLLLVALVILVYSAISGIQG